jgi:hypothetical protein
VRSLAITGPRDEVQPNGMRRLSAMVGDQDVWFEVPADREVELRGEPFVIAALLPAMITGQPIVGHPDLPICPVLREGLDRLQAIFRLWGPSMRADFRPIPVDVPLAPAPPGRGPGSFFSGGVDGLYTWLEAPERLAHAAFVRGIDFQLDNPVYDESFARNASWLAERGTALIPMNSNIRFVGRAFRLGWNNYFGAGLSALAHVLGYSTTYIAAGHGWAELWPDGSHPATDHFWSSATRRMVHHGRGALRWQKLERLAQEPGALGILRVCWQDKGFNCGRCEKCLRTMVLLRILGLDSPNFPVLDDLRAIEQLVTRDRSEAAFNREALALAKERGDQAVAAALASADRRWQFRRIGRMVGEGLPWLRGRRR